MRSYRPNSFASFWIRLEQLITDKRCVISEEVRIEVEQGTTKLVDWVKQHPGLVIDFDRCQEQIVQQVMRDYKRLINLRKNKGWADPFVIALAKCGGHTVVTEEGLGSPDSPKIPYVCKELGVPCINLARMIEDEGWTF